jgi:hypothetical protein
MEVSPGSGFRVAEDIARRDHILVLDRLVRTLGRTVALAANP